MAGSDLTVDHALETLADTIAKREHQTDTIVLIGIIENGYHLAKRLIRLIKVKTSKRVVVGKLDVSLFRKDLDAENPFLTLEKTLIPCKLSGKTVILINDFLDTGHDIAGALNALSDFDTPHSVELAVLADTGRSCYPFRATFEGLPSESLKGKTPQLQLLERDGEDNVTFA